MSTGTVPEDLKKMSDSNKSIALPTFNGKVEDYQVWWTKFMAFATAKGFEQALLGRETDLPAMQKTTLDPAKDKEKIEAKQRNSLAMAYLLSALKTQADISMAYDAMDTDWPGGLACKVVENLESVYRPKDTITEVEVYTKLLGVKMKKNEDPKTLFEQIAAIQNWYNTGNKVLPKEQLIAVVIKAAPKEYMSVITSEQHAKGSSLTLTNLRVVMNQYYWSMNQGKKSSNDEEGDELQMATVDKPGRGPKCYGCGQHGHIRRDCPKKKNNKDSSNRSHVKCSGCGKEGHKYKNCWENPKNKDKAPKWYLDKKKEVNAAEADQEHCRELQMVGWTDHPEFFEEEDEDMIFKEFEKSFDMNQKCEAVALLKEQSRDYKQSYEKSRKQKQSHQSRELLHGTMKNLNVMPAKSNY